MNGMNSIPLWYDARMIRDFIIDGYNLMHAAGFARPTYGPGGLERSRNRLLARLKELMTEEERQRTTVVFDAKNAPLGGADVEVRHEIYIVFAQDTDEADDMIEHLITRHSAPKQLLIVSSDHRLHKAARRRKSKACDSDRFLDRLEDRLTRHAEFVEDIPVVDETETELSAEQMQHWLNEFSDVDVDEIRRETGEKPRVEPGAPEAQHEKRTDRKQKVRQLDVNELAMWEDLLGDIIREDDGDLNE